METEGIVSAWIGVAKSAQDFARATAVSFSEDGDFLGSKFGQALSIGYYDSSLMEAAYRGRPCDTLRELLQGISYADQILPQLEASGDERGSNCFVLLYNYQYCGALTLQEEGLTLRFLGLATFRPA
jgi:hypothetical protein